MLLTGISATGAALLVRLWRGEQMPAAALVAALAALISLELTALNPPPHRFDGGQLKYAGALGLNADIAAFVKAQPGWPRVDVNDQDVLENFGDWRGVESTAGYVAGVPRALYDAELHTGPVQRIFGVTHSIARKPYRDGLREVFTGESGVKVFEVPGALPRARAVHEVVRAASAPAMRAMIEDPSFDLAAKAVMTGPPPKLETCAGEDNVRMTRHNPDRVTIEVRMACRGLVVLGDSYYPGWRATVDGRPADVLEVYGAVRGVAVDAGAHSVEFRFLPVSVLGGAGLTLLGLIVTAAAVLRRR